jgi:hypothetical protein
MPITTTLGTLVQAAEPALTNLAKIRLPAKTAYHIAKLLRAVREETAHFHAERNALVERWGDERDATPIEQKDLGAARLRAVRPEHIAEFVAAVEELSALTVEIAVAPLTLEALGAIDVPAADLLALGPLLAAPEEDKP